MGHDLLLHVLSILMVSVIAIALCHRFGLSPILGYLATGVLVGPHVFGWLPGPERTRDFAELGVVLLMFTVGLEFSWSRLLAAKRLVLGLGGAQVAVATLLFGFGAWLLIGEPDVSLIIGAALAMSSTAIVLKLLTEQLELGTTHGRVVFGILLFQDIAAVAFLVMLPILASDRSHLAAALAVALLKAGLLLLALVVIGRRMLPPLLHRVADTYSQELFIATTLVMALAAAGLSAYLGLSATLGAFMAGTLLGETLFRHQIEADIRPFRDLMLGVFFITIGMQLDGRILFDSPVAVLLLLLVLVPLKAVLMVALLRVFGQPMLTAWRVSLSLSQGGEFGLLLISVGMASGLIRAEIGQPVLVGLVLSMAAAALLVRFNGLLAVQLSGRSSTTAPEDAQRAVADASADLADHVILCGYGRVGQNLARLLEQEAIPVLSLDLDPVRVKQADSAGELVLYGDAGRREILHAAGIGRARALVITFDDPAAAERIVSYVHHRYTDLPILVRSVRGRDNDSLLAAGAEVFPEGLEASLAFAGQLLLLLGVPPERVEARLNDIRLEDYAPLRAFFHDTHGAGDQANDYPDQVRTVTLGDNDSAVGRALGEIEGLTENVKITDVRRGSLRIPLENTRERLRPGDVLVVQGAPQAIERMIQRIAARSGGTV